MYKFKVFYESYPTEIIKSKNHGALLSISREGRSQCYKIIEVDNLECYFNKLIKGIQEEGFSNMITYHFKLNDDGSIDNGFEEERIMKMYEKYPKLKEAMNKIFQ